MNNVYDVIFQLRDNASGALSRIEAGIKGVSGSLERARASWSGFVSASQAAATGLGVVGAGLAAVGGAAVKAAADFEQSQIAFTTLLGNGQKAKQFLEDLQTFANNTPFEFKGLQDSARQLLAFGFQAQNILPIMTSIGDAVSALGGGQFEIQRVTLALGQMQAKGKVTAEEMMQLAETGLPVWEILSKKIGKSVSETMKAASDGAISASQGVSAILQGLEERFHGSMEAQSKTLAGLFSTFSDSASTTLRIVGQEIVQALDLSEVVSRAIVVLNKLQDWAKNGGVAQAFAWIKENAVLLAGTLTGVLAPAIISATTAAGAFIARVAPLAAIGVGVASAINALGLSFNNLPQIFALVAQAVSGLVEMFQGVVVAAKGMADYIGAFFRSIASNFGEYFKAAADSITKFQHMDFLGAYQSWQTAMGLFNKATQAGTTNLTDAFAKAEPLLSSGISKVVQTLNGNAAPKFKNFADEVTKSVNQVSDSLKNLANLGNLGSGSSSGGAGSNSAKGWTVGAVEALLPAARALVQQVEKLQAAGKFLLADDSLRKFFAAGGEAAQKAYEIAEKEIKRAREAAIASAKSIAEAVQAEFQRAMDVAAAKAQSLGQAWAEKQQMAAQAAADAAKAAAAAVANDWYFAHDSMTKKAEAWRLAFEEKQQAARRAAEEAAKAAKEAWDRAMQERKTTQELRGVNADLPGQTDKQGQSTSGIEDYSIGTPEHPVPRQPGLTPVPESTLPYLLPPEPSDNMRVGFTPILTGSPGNAAGPAVIQDEGGFPTADLPFMSEGYNGLEPLSKAPTPVTTALSGLEQVVMAFQSLFGGIMGPLQVFGEILQRINPIAAIMEGFMSALAPAIESLTEPMKLLGGILATLVMPVFEVLHPILKVVAYAFGMVALIVAKVWNALAWLIEKITFGFVRLYIDESKIQNALNQLGDSAINTSNALNSLTQSAGVPSGFKAAYAVYTATNPTVPGVIPILTGGGNSVTMNIYTNDPERMAQKLDDYYARRNYVRTGSALGAPGRLIR